MSATPRMPASAVTTMAIQTQLPIDLYQTRVGPIRLVLYTDYFNTGRLRALFRFGHRTPMNAPRFNMTLAVCRVNSPHYYVPGSASGCA